MTPVFFLQVSFWQIADVSSPVDVFVASPGSPKARAAGYAATRQADQLLQASLVTALNVKSSGVAT